MAARGGGLLRRGASASQGGFGYPHAVGGNHLGGTMPAGQSVGGYGSTMASFAISEAQPQSGGRAMAQPRARMYAVPPPSQSVMARSSTLLASGATAPAAPPSIVQMPPSQLNQLTISAAPPQQLAVGTPIAQQPLGPNRLLAAIDRAGGR